MSQFLIRKIDTTLLSEFGEQHRWPIYGGNDWFAAYVSGEIVGCGAVGPDGHIHSGFVSPSFRGRGIQKLLIESRIEHIQQSGLNFAYSLIFLNNTPSIRSASNAGLKLMGCFNHMEVWGKYVS